MASSMQVLIAAGRVFQPACCPLGSTCMLALHMHSFFIPFLAVGCSFAVVSTVERVTPPARVSASLERMTAGFDPDRWAWRKASRQHGSNALLAAAQSSACLQRLHHLPLTLPASCEPTPCCCVPRGLVGRPGCLRLPADAWCFPMAAWL